MLFLDEPTVGLDPRIRHELLDVIAGLRERSEMTILLTTHYLDEAATLSDRIAIMRAGRIVATGTPQQLVASLRREILEVRVHGNADTALTSLRTGGIADGDAFAVGSTLIVPTRERAPDQVISAVRGVDIATVSIGSRPPTLEDVYLRHTGDQIADAA